MPFEQYEKIFKEVGFEIVEIKDISQTWSEGSWNRSNNFYLKHYEAEGRKLSADNKFFSEQYGIRQAKLLSNLEHMTAEEIRNKYPVTSKYVDPDVWVHGTEHGNIKAIRYVIQKSSS